MRLRLGGIAVLALLVAVGIVLLAAAPARAVVDNGCTATLNGTDLTNLPANPDHALTVGKDDVVPMTMTSTNGKKFDNLNIDLVFVGQAWDVYNDPAGGGTWSKNIDVHSFAKYGVGLYELRGVGTYTDGTTCGGRAYIRVDGNPFSTVAGIAGAASTGVGIASIFGAAAAGGGGGSGPGGSFTQADAKAEGRREEEERQTDTDIIDEAARAPFGGCFLFGVLLLPLLLLAGTGALLMAIAAPAVRVRRRTWPLVLGAFGGLLTGLGAGVLLQEYAVIYPTRTWGIVYLAGGILVGLAIPLLRRSLSRR